MIRPGQRELIKKLFDRNCTKEDLDQIFDLVKYLSQEEAERVIEELWAQKIDYPQLETALSEKMYDSIFGKIQEKTPTEQLHPTPIVPIRQARQRRLRWASIASVLLLLSGILTWIWFQNEPAKTISTDYAEQKTDTLPDGSIVQLYANSTLKYHLDWEQQPVRQVWLTGEAFFQVISKKETGQKFQVITNDLVVEVWGTVFNVNSQRKQTMVYLEEGEVRLNFNGLEEELVLEPGEEIAYSKTSPIVPDIKRQKSKNYVPWKEGVLDLMDTPTPLVKVLQKLEENYGVDFELKDPAVGQREINTGIPLDDLGTAIGILKAVLRLEIQKDGDSYIVQ